MKKRLIYLAGPINGCTDEECKDWREDAKKYFGEDNTLDPMRRDYRGRETEFTAEIVEGDKADIDASTILLVNHPRPSTGTDMEIFYAWERKKKVIVVVPPTSNTKISPWLDYHSHKIFFSFENALTYIGRESE
jgi:nucleoside 2-deoxyribosyltransferase